MRLKDRVVLKAQDVFHDKTPVREIAIGATSYKVPLRGRLSQEHLVSYEEYFAEMIEFAMGERPGTFVDVGVNVGQILLKVKSVEPGRIYVGFEPSLGCCKYTEELITLNRLRDCTLVPIGLSAAPGVLTFHFDSESDPRATMIDGFWTAKDERRFARHIYVDTGDSVMAGLGGKVAILKVDVEGGELEVFSGFTATIARDGPLILAEVLPYVPKSDPEEAKVMAFRKTRCEALLALFAELDYVPFRVLPGRKLERVDHFGADSFVASMTNYMMVPQGEVAGLLAKLG